MSEDGCGLFLSMFEYTQWKDPVFATIAQSTPHNARYTSHDIQNELMGVIPTRGWGVGLYGKSGLYWRAYRKREHFYNCAFYQ